MEATIQQIKYLKKKQNNFSGKEEMQDELW